MHTQRLGSMEDTQKTNWYVLKIFFNKTFDVEAYLDKSDIESYLPIQKVLLKGLAHLLARKKLAQAPGHRDPRYLVEEPKIYLRKPLVSSLLFLHCTPVQLRDVAEYLREKDANGNIRGYIYKNTDREWAVVPDKEMASFRLVVEAGSRDLQFFADDDISRYATGDHVRVIEGPLKGTEGYIKRIRRDRKLLVVIEGIIAVATSYIPPQNLEKI